MSRLIDLTGKRFGRLSVLCRNGSDNFKNAKWNCLCDCGNRVDVVSANLNKQNTMSCGCYQRDRTGEAGRRHGHAPKNAKRSREYHSWASAKKRCVNPKATAYKDYGGRGITMCDEWKNSFEAFLRDMGECPPGLTIERMNNDNGYEPGNCKWATRLEQSHNQRPRLHAK